MGLQEKARLSQLLPTDLAERANMYRGFYWIDKTPSDWDYPGIFTSTTEIDTYLSTTVSAVKTALEGAK